MRVRAPHRNACFRIPRPGRVRPDITALAAALAVTASAMAGPPAARQELPAEYLPAAHPAWRDLETLWNRGALSGLPIFTRPLPRADIARALRATIDAHPDLATLPAARRLERELAFELETLDRPGSFRETHPPLEIREDGSIFRIQLESLPAATFTGREGELLPGTGMFLVARAYLPGRAFALADWGVEKILDDTDIGDSIVKGSDWFQSSTASYVSFRTQAVELAAGFSRHRWGPGASGTLLLSDAALSYPGIFYGANLGRRARFLAVTGALHLPVNVPARVPGRLIGGNWFSAHRFEVALGESFRIGIQESAAYRSSGLDLLYTVGLVPYTLVQRFHDRTTDPGDPVRTNRNNVMAGLDFAWRFAPGWRLDGQLLVDDVATESSTQPDRLGYQAGVSWSGDLLGGGGDLRLEFSKVYRYTYAVFYDANHIHDDVPLGFGLGNDIEHAILFAERDLGPDLRLGIGADLTRRGEGRVGEFWDPNDPQSRHSAAKLSGTIETRFFPHARSEVYWRDLARVHGRLGILRVTNLDHRKDLDRTSVHGEIEARIQW